MYLIYSRCPYGEHPCLNVHVPRRRVHVASVVGDHNGAGQPRHAMAVEHDVVQAGVAVHVGKVTS